MENYEENKCLFGSIYVPTVIIAITFLPKTMCGLSVFELKDINQMDHF